MKLNNELKEKVIKIAQLVLDIDWDSREEKVLFDIFKDYVLFAITKKYTNEVVKHEQITFYNKNAIATSNDIIIELKKRI